MNRLNSIVGSRHVFNCINYLLHTSVHTVQAVWGKLIIAACFKSVLHPRLTTLSHFLTEMKDLGSRSGTVGTDAGLRCTRRLKRIHRICSGIRFLQAVCVSFTRLLDSPSFLRVSERKNCALQVPCSPQTSDSPIKRPGSQISSLI